MFAASNREDKEEIGETVIDRGYFKWAQTAKNGEYKVFAPVVSKIGASKGHYIIPVSSPIIRDGKFDGVVTSAITLSDLTKSYLTDIKALDKGKIYLIVDDGEIVYSDDREFITKNYKDIFPKEFIGRDKVFSIIDSQLGETKEANIQMALPNFDNKFKLESYLISAAPVQLTGNLWKVVIAIPEKDLQVYTYSIFNKQIFAVFIVVTLFILLTLRASRNVGYNTAVVDEHKLHHLDEEGSLISSSKTNTKKKN